MEELLTKRGILLCLAVVFLLIAWNRAINLLYGMFSLLCATLLLAALLPKVSLRGVSATRTLPERAFEGDVVEVSVSVKNTGWLTRFMVEVVDSIPALEGSLQRPMTFVARLPARSRKAYAFQVECHLRGEYTVGPLALRSAYPLGIFAVERALAGSTQPLLVYPQVFPIARLPLLAGSRTFSGGMEALSRASGSDAFISTREYHDGDSLRYVHWPSTARHGELIVKELETRGFRETAILLDLHRKASVGEGRENSIEYGVKIAASLSGFILEQGHSLQLMGYGKEPWIVPYARGASQHARILEALARVRADGSLPFPEALLRALDNLTDGGTLVLVCAEPEAELSAFAHVLSVLRAKRIGCIGVFLDPESFAEGPVRFSPYGERLLLMDALEAQGCPVYRISRGDDLEAVFSS